LPFFLPVGDAAAFRGFPSAWKSSFEVTGSGWLICRCEKKALDSLYTIIWPMTRFYGIVVSMLPGVTAALERKLEENFAVFFGARADSETLIGSPRRSAGMAHYS